MSVDPAGAQLMMPMDEEGNPREGFSVVESTNWYSYVSNNPVRYVDPTGLSGVSEQPSQPWELSYQVYYESVVEQIEPRSRAEERKFHQDVERAVVGMSSEQFKQAQSDWLESRQLVSDKRIEIQNELTQLRHLLARSEGNKDEAAIVLTLGAAAGTSEYLASGSAQGISETAYQAGEFLGTHVDLMDQVAASKGRIDAQLSEFQAIQSTADMVSRRFFAERKRRDYWGIE